ncbi:FHA domain-containing protein [Nocardioides sp. AX2bis]|uniref:FHA domain-containing protein n=1 Tax=Nocardioides sp. AX2bis TaxID=2653157 RepID=UPI0012F44BFE|nr:FHA domain-containing protein [Nocardioides sp. AX2bis]VXB17384.1 conserved hypothetical protein [Nocardioides sp. AX2bis]
MTLVVGADLRFEIGREDGSAVHGRLRGSGNRLELEVDEPGAFAGRADAPAIRTVAETLARYGVVVKVVSGGEHLVSLGAVKAPWWQRRATGSRRIRIGSVRGALTSARSRARAAEPVLPSNDLVPPMPVWPIAPTFQRNPRVGRGGTHGRGGSPRLVLFKADVVAGERQPIFWLGETTVVGSDPSCDVVLPGLADRQVVIRHSDDDEYVVTTLAGRARVHGAQLDDRVVLRAGARLEVGDHLLVFSRAEHADHGRPFGGRVGGELGRQERQPPRGPTTD